MAASSSSSSLSTREHAEGSCMISVPTPIIDAPASSSSRASRPVRTPPVPMIGMSGNAALTCHTHRTATGLMAGPDRPPYLPASAGRMVAGSMTMPSSVLISDRPSAPDATQALATATMSVTSGDSLAKTGMSYLALPRTAAITLPARCGSSANGCPASSASGQDRLTSMAVTPAVSESLAASAAYSRMVWPAIETTTRAPRDSSQGRSRCRKASMPGFCRPTEFSRPLGVSASRGAGLPVWGSAMIDLLISAPTRATSMNWASSRPAPAQPAAASTRLGSSAWGPGPSLALMSAGIAGFRCSRRVPPRGAECVERDRADVVPADQVATEHRPVHARADDPGDPVGAGHRQHAAHAHPGPAGHRHVHRGLDRDVVPAGDRGDLAQHRHRRARVDHVGARLADDLFHQARDGAAGAERAVRAVPAEQVIDAAAALPQPRRQREQRRAAVADAEQQAARRVPGDGKGPAERPYRVQHVPGAQRGQPARARPAGLEHELHRAAVVGAHVVHGEGTPPEHGGLRAADRDRDELTGAELGRDGGRDQRQRVIGVDAPQGQHGAADLHWGHKRPAGRATGCIIWAACSWSDRTPTSPRMMASIPCTAAASPAAVVTQGMPRRTAAVRIS